MHYNPFAQGRFIGNGFRGNHPMNLFDRIVGRPSQMGILDYLFVVPFIFKSLYAFTRDRSYDTHRSMASRKRNGFLKVIFGAVTIPLAIAKFAVYVALSPVTFIFWALKNIISGEIKKHAKSPLTRALNELDVITAADMNNDAAPLHKLYRVNKLYNVSLMTHSIRVNERNQIVLTHMGNTVAIIPQTRSNIVKLKEILGVRAHDDRIHHQLDNMGRQIFNYNDLPALHDLVNARSDYQFVRATQNLYNTLVGPKNLNKPKVIIADKKILVPSPDLRLNNEMVPETNYGDLPRDIRELIFNETIAAVVNDKDIRTLSQGLFASFTPAERQAGVEELVKRNTAPK